MTPMACNNMNEPEGHYENWNMPVSKGQLLHNSIYEVSKKKSKDCQRLRGGNRSCYWTGIYFQLCDVTKLQRSTVQHCTYS